MWYSLEPPRRGDSNEYANICFEHKYGNIRVCLFENFQFLEVKLSVYLNTRDLIMERPVNLLKVGEGSVCMCERGGGVWGGHVYVGRGVGVGVAF